MNERKSDGDTYSGGEYARLVKERIARGIPEWGAHMREEDYAATYNLRARIASRMTSSGGSAMFEDDRNPSYLLFLASCVLMGNNWQIPEDRAADVEEQK